MFATVTRDQYEIIDEMFIEDGAGDMLGMVCSGIRHAQEKHKHP